MVDDPIGAASQTGSRTQSMTDAQGNLDRAALLGAFPNPALLVGPEGSILDVNEAALTLFGYDRADLLGAPVEVLVPDSVRTRHVDLRVPGHNAFARPMGLGRELSGRHRSGATIHLEIALQPIELLGGRHVVVSCIDVGQRQEDAERLVRLALTDALTNLPNERVAREVIAAELATGDGTFAVLYLDLDGFKAVNDRLSHAAGDEVLLAVAGRIAGCVRESDVPARLHGDEFAVVLRSPLGLGEAIAVADRILAALAEPINVTWEQSVVQVGASMGLALAGEPDSPATVDDILDAADAALREAKRSGRGRLVLSAAPGDRSGRRPGSEGPSGRNEGPRPSD